MLGFPILCLKGMRIMMFQLSSFYFHVFGLKARVSAAIFCSGNAERKPVESSLG